MANGSLSSQQSGEGAIREALVRDDIVDCVVALPAALFFTTGIPVSLWFLDRNKARRDHSDRRTQILFIDARSFGRKVSRTQIELTAEEIERIAGTYHSWRKDGGAGYADISGYCRSVSLEEVEAHGFVLTPGRFVGAETAEYDAEAFDDAVRDLVGLLDRQLRESAEIDGAIREGLRQVGYDLEG